MNGNARRFMRCGFAIALAFAAETAPADESKCPPAGAAVFSADLLSIPDCIAAHDLHRDCARAPQDDVSIAGGVTAKCEAGFLSRLSGEPLRIYVERGASCDAANVGASPPARALESAMCREDLASAYFRDSVSGPIMRAPQWVVPPPGAR